MEGGKAGGRAEIVWGGGGAGALRGVDQEDRAGAMGESAAGIPSEARRLCPMPTVSLCRRVSLFTITGACERVRAWLCERGCKRESS